jgi:EAL domain-containing protein (putative c-di-GMP-specific phosphodiesterase class I)
MDDISDLLLVIDDHESRLQEARALAERLGCEWVVADSSDALRDILALRSPTLALVAIDMQDDDGIATMLMLASAAAPPACVLIGEVEARVVGGARRLAEQHGLKVLGTLCKPLALSDAEPLFTPALSGDQAIPQADLRLALEEHQFLLHFQPQAVFDGDGLRIRGAEALVRWQHPRRGLMFPAQFLPSVERVGLIGALTDYVITEAVRQAGDWNKHGHPLLITVNLSPRLVRDRQFPTRLATLLHEFELSAEQLNFDVTEESSNVDHDRLLDAFTRLRLLGIGLTLDNFGTGYSSLTELYTMPYTEVKIDRSLIGALPENVEAGIVVEAMAGLAHKLGLRICAAGVESAAALQELRAYGFDAVQGRAISDAIPASRIDELLRDWQSPPAPLAASPRNPAPAADVSMPPQWRRPA